MRSGRINVLLLLFITALWNVYMLSYIDGRAQKINYFPYQAALEQLIEQDISEEALESFWEFSEGDMEQFCRLLTVYYGTEKDCDDPEILEKEAQLMEEYQPEDFTGLYENVYSVWHDISCFPVGSIDNMPEADVVFENSWKQARTFGGNRVHEGTDLMATENSRGIYPIYSVSDGVIENIGWLKLGGYRIGIRSPSGAYYYYAHMAEYARDFSVGEEVAAGTFLGFMGDTGYSEVPGTTGNFAVHLHFGIYLSDAEGKEFAINSYPVLRFLKNHGVNR